MYMRDDSCDILVEILLPAGTGNERWLEAGGPRGPRSAALRPNAERAGARTCSCPRAAAGSAGRSAASLRAGENQSPWCWVSAAKPADRASKLTTTDCLRLPRLSLEKAANP